MKFSKKVMMAAGVLALGMSAGAFAATAGGVQVAAAPAAASAATLTAGEVRKVDQEQGRVTIKHDPIANLDMPAMTMVFRADKPELLKNLKAGDKVRFHAESVGGALVVTQIEAAQ
jgi:Cu(I)/Ag(I) efflux system periplasmic protein CusF